MIKQRYDYLILGQGLAGTALAWELLWQDFRVLIIDRGETVTTSQVAAGLINPVTGQRLVKSWRWYDFYPYAQQFYQKTEQITGSRFFYPLTMLRLFKNNKEQKVFQKKRESEFLNLIGHHSLNSSDMISPNWIETPYGGFELESSAQLRTTEYLDSSRNYFEQTNSYLQHDLDINNDLIVTQNEVLIPSLNLEANHLIFCQGYEATQNKWFNEIEFTPAKGEILTVKIPGFTEERIINHGLWMVPLGNELFKVGSTYEWDQLDNISTQQGREEICQRLQKFLKLPFEVIDQGAAVRPVLFDQKPMAGFHPTYPQLGIINGLGSKGSLQAPLISRWLIEHHLRQHPLPPEVRLRTRKQSG